MENARDFNEDFVLLEFVDESFMSRGKIYHENILDKNSKYSWTEDDPIFVYLNANHLGIHVGDPASVDQNEGREENQTQEIKFNLLKSSNDKYPPIRRRVNGMERFFLEIADEKLAEKFDSRFRAKKSFERLETEFNIVLDIMLTDSFYSFTEQSDLAVPLKNEQEGSMLQNYQNLTSAGLNKISKIYNKFKDSNIDIYSLEHGLISKIDNNCNSEIKITLQPKRNLVSIDNAFYLKQICLENSFLLDKIDGTSLISNFGVSISFQNIFKDGSTKVFDLEAYSKILKILKSEELYLKISELRVNEELLKLEFKYCDHQSNNLYRFFDSFLRILIEYFSLKH